MIDLKLAACQINFTVGDTYGNLTKIKQFYDKSLNLKADIVVFSELALCGYMHKDLIYNKVYREELNEAIGVLISYTKDKNSAIIIGHFKEIEGKLYNCALLIENGKILEEIFKYNLPTYGVFEEKRYYKSGYEISNPRVITFRSKKIGIIVCEDIWFEEIPNKLKREGAELFIVINGSPFDKRKFQKRLKIIRKNTKDLNIPLIYINQVGAEDGVIFDGSSFQLNKEGDIVSLCKFFEEDLKIFDISKESIYHLNLPNEQELIYHAIILGLRDYVEKNNMKDVILGFSGGIDSALTAVIAIDALGYDRVKIAILPTKYNSKETFRDLADFQKIHHLKEYNININASFEHFLSLLGPHFENKKPDITEENLQSRIRGLILMALSNKHGYLLLTTGNKSEMATGYATIYGDMCGGFNLIKDLYKTEVFKLSKWRNNNKTNLMFGKSSIVIPENIIEKAPSAELKENQKDEDNLPKYEILDKILFYLIEHNMSSKEIIDLGYKEETVLKVSKLLYQSEWKRKQSAIGVKISSMSFDSDRRYPITNRFKN